MQAVEAEPLGPLWTVALTLALRPSEALGLRWEDISDDEVRIRQSVQYVGGQYRSLQPKTAEAARAIRYPPALRAVFSRQRALQLEICLGALVWADSGLVFTNRQGGPLHEPWVNRRLAITLALARLPHVTFYQLRHTGATLMLSMGVPLEAIGDVMGHSGLATTRKYAQLLDADRERTAERLGEWLGSIG